MRTKGRGHDPVPRPGCTRLFPPHAVPLLSPAHSAASDSDLGHDSAASHPGAGGRGGQGPQGLALAAVALPTQERTLRALLQKAKMVLAQQSQQQAPPPSGQLQGAGEAGAGGGAGAGAGGGVTRHLGDSELVRINTQLLEVTANLRPGGFGCRSVQ